jgi:thiol-disulfide isomerase/thioredoxin
MLKHAYIILIFLLSTGFMMAQKPVPVYDFDGFEPLLHQNNDTVYVLNFWATWCKPCVKELPAFEKLNEKFEDGKVKVLLVSLDFIKHYDSRLLPFITEHDLDSEVLLLNDPQSNRWIDKVSPEWSGAIPATLIYKDGMREFYERSFTYSELESEVQKFIKYSGK